MRTSRLALAALPCLLVFAGCRSASAPATGAKSETTAVPREQTEGTKLPATAPGPAEPLAKADDAKEKGAPATLATATAAASDAPAGPGRGGLARAIAASPPAPPMAAPAKHGSGADKADPWGGGSGSAAREDGIAFAQPQFAGVKAGEWDDNANYRDFQKFLGSQQVTFHPVDLRFRRFLVVRDAQGKPVPRCRVRVSDDQQHEASFFTTAGGHAIFFPKGEGLTGSRFTASASCEGATTSQQFALQDDTDGIVDLRFQKERAAIQTRTVDLAFVLDTTGSMAEEISAVRQTIQKVAQQLQTSETRVRVGLVEYKDRTDPFVTKVYPFSTDLQGFAAKVSHIDASGGGDTPEDMNAGVHTAVSQLQWSEESVARMAFVIADAPPHLDYQDGPDYAKDMKTAAHRGIQLFTVSASGMDAQGQVVMRQMAQYTGGTNMFVLRGGAGPQSTGGGDPGSSCGGTHQSYASGNLHELITSKIKHELKSIDGDPMRIAGLHTDENAKPCDQRIVWMD